MKLFASCDLKDAEGLSGQLIGYRGSADFLHICCNLIGRSVFSHRFDQNHHWRVEPSCRSMRICLIDPEDVSPCLFDGDDIAS